MLRRIRTVSKRLLNILAIAFLTIACQPDTSIEKTTTGGQSLVSITHDEWLETLAAYKPDIVVVDLWATWCVSCLERFPKMVEMHEHFAKDGVSFVSLCLDDRQDKDAMAYATLFLTEMNADFDHFFLDENLMVAFAKLELIGIPAVLIYDRNGEEAYRLTGDDPNNQFGADDVESSIRALLKSRTPQ